MPALTSAHESAAERSSAPVPGSPAAAGRGWLVALWAVCALYAGGVAVLTSSGVQRQWALVAAPGYAAAAVAAGWKRRGADAAVALSLIGGLLAPLAWLAAGNQAEREVGVITRSAWMLIHHGTPYHAVAALTGTQNPDAYNPYLPAMAVFGLPRALAGASPPTDPRIWFAVAFAAALWLALRATATPASGRWTALVTATPVIAFPLAVGGDDVPVLGLMCLGLALLARPGDKTLLGRPGDESSPILAGLALGVAAAMKATAWPALLVAAVLVAARDGSRATARFAAAALAVLALLVGPVAAVSPAALADNTILFPLGLASVRSGATSPLPGFLLASAGSAGHLIATGLLVLAALAVAVSLIVRPPRQVGAATWRLIIGLVLMFTLAPSTRFGYYLYPLGLWAWLRISRPPSAQPPPATAAGRSRLRRAADWVLVAGADAGSSRIPLCG